MQQSHVTAKQLEAAKTLRPADQGVGAENADKHGRYVHPKFGLTVYPVKQVWHELSSVLRQCEMHEEDASLTAIIPLLKQAMATKPTVSAGTCATCKKELKRGKRVERAGAVVTVHDGCMLRGDLIA